MELSNLMSSGLSRVRTNGGKQVKIFKPSQMPQAAYASEMNALLGFIYIYI